MEELTAQGLFEKEDWEMLYAFASDISGEQGDDYRQGWSRWAEGQPQTAGQWRQYFEKVVLPQWQLDSDEKHALIKNRVEKRQEEKDRQKGSHTSQLEAPSMHDQQHAESSPPHPRASSTKRKRNELDDNTFESYLSEHRKGKAPSAYVHFAREKKWDLWNQKPELDYGTCYYSNSFAVIEH